jgi:hypothetical protein
MDIINAQVNHRTYGNGVIVGQADNIITVKFAYEHGTKKFLYPSIFESYLSFSNEHLQSEQLAEITRQRAEFEAEAAQKKQQRKILGGTED